MVLLGSVVEKSPPNISRASDPGYMPLVERMVAPWLTSHRSEELGNGHGVLVGAGVKVGVKVAVAVGVLVDVLVGVLVAGVPVAVTVGVRVAGSPGTNRQAENSEVLPVMSVAVEVINSPPPTPTGSVKVKAALQSASVFTVVCPRYISPSPWPDGSQTRFAKNCRV